MAQRLSIDESLRRLQRMKIGSRDPGRSQINSDPIFHPLEPAQRLIDVRRCAILQRSPTPS